MASVKEVAEMIYDVIDRKFTHMKGSCLTATIRDTKDSIQVKTADKSIWFISEEISRTKLLTRESRKKDIEDLIILLSSVISSPDSLFDIDKDTDWYLENSNKNQIIDQ